MSPQNVFELRRVSEAKYASARHNLLLMVALTLINVILAVAKQAM